MDAQKMTEKAQDWLEQCQETAERFKERAEDWQRKARHNARKAARMTDNYVHDNPWESVGYVAAATFIIGFLLGRVRRD